MKNRAKCKLCQSVIESFHGTDYVACKCGEISVDGGPEFLYCAANDWKNFLRIDEFGNEIIPTIKNVEEIQGEKPNTITRKDKINMLHEMIKSIERLPKEAMDCAITHSDFCSALLLLYSILQED